MGGWWMAMLGCGTVTAPGFPTTPTEPSMVTTAETGPTTSTASTSGTADTRGETGDTSGTTGDTGVKTVTPGGALLGPFPFTGAPRVSIGVFYEGGATVSYPLDALTREYFIFEGSIEVRPSKDRIEGFESTVMTVTGNRPWFGSGVVHEPSLDLSDWTTLHLGLKSTEVTFEDAELSIDDDKTVTSSVAVSDYGFRADGNWHALVVPLDDFGGVDRSALRLVFSLTGDVGVPGTELLIDDVYFTQE